MARMCEPATIPRRWPRTILAALAVVAAGALVLHLMGRVPICRCGYVKLWQGEVFSSENSQHIADWYSLSHVVHGLLFYLALRLGLPRLDLSDRFLLATVVETAWEVIENTDFVIQRYREATIALDYYGDSILNSVSDIGFMMLGFAFAARFPPWASLVLGLALELVAAFAIRDNLTLNVIMLLYPHPAIRAWQMGG